jgi:beta-lactamase regulating signal transducer with metallopeptidase domain
MNSTIFLLCDLAAKSAVLALFGFGTAAFLRRAAHAWRAFAWSCTILAMAALPALRPMVPKIAVPWPRPAIAWPATSLYQQASGPAKPSPIVAAAVPASRGDSAAFVWALGTLAVAGYFGLGYLALRRWKRRSRPAQCQAEIPSIAEELGIRRTVCLLEAAECQIPVTWGWRRPVVLLPAAASQWDLSRRRQVLLHELAHIRRGDWLIQIIIQAICAAYWWNPLVWLCARQWRAACEEACDDLVLTRGIRPSEYAESLLVLTRAFNGRSIAALGMVQSSRLNRRIRGILETTNGREPVSALGKLTLASLSILACVATAGLADTPAPAPGESGKPAFSQAVHKRPVPGEANVGGDHTYFENGIAIAEGHATLTYWDAKLVATVMKADKIRFEGRRAVGVGHVVVTQGYDEISALAQTTTITINLDTGTFSAIGPHKTVILEQPPKLAPEQPASAQPAK